MVLQKYFQRRVPILLLHSNEKCAVSKLVLEVDIKTQMLNETDEKSRKALRNEFMEPYARHIQNPLNHRQDSGCWREFP